jgi:hypothetical protein
MTPVPVPPTVTLNITGRCALACAFCIADAGRRSPIRDMEPGFVRDVARRFEGIRRVILMGGEPFEHPAITEIVAALSARSVGEIEIFTSGAWLLGGRRARVLDLLSAVPASRVALTFAVDDFHRHHFGERYPALLADALSLEGERPSRAVRFNVTSERITSRRYVSEAEIEAILAPFGPAVQGAYVDARRRGAVAERFYFNPVVRQGRQVGGAGEHPKLSDLVRNPEIVIAAREDAPTMFSSLNASWLPSPPAFAVLGRFGRDRPEDMVARFAARVLGLPEAPDPEALQAGDGARALEARAVLELLGDPAPARAWADAMASRSLGALDVGGDAIHEASAEGDLDLFDLRVIRALVGLLCREEANRRTLLDGLARTLETEVLERGLSPVAVLPALDDFGVSDGDDAAVPLARTCLSLGDARHPAGEKLVTVRPVLLAGQGLLSVSIRGLAWERAYSADEASASLARYLEDLAFILGPELFAGLAARHVPGRGAPLADALPAFAPILAAPEAFALRDDACDAVRWFDRLTFQRSIGKPLYDNPILLDEVLALPLPGCTESSARRLRDKARYFAERLRHETNA